MMFLFLSRVPITGSAAVPDVRQTLNLPDDPRDMGEREEGWEQCVFGWLNKGYCRPAQVP